MEEEGKEKSERWVDSSDRNLAQWTERGDAT